MRELLLEKAEEIAGELIELAKNIFEDRELSFEEHRSSKRLMAYLEEKGFRVEANIAGLETAFVASYGAGKPNIALLSEYDALPEVGHGCGHNMIGVMSVGAAVVQVLANVLSNRSGTITVVGCPAEERGNVKGELVRAGVFKEIDTAFMIHPATLSAGFDIAYAIQHYKIEFFGKSAHAASDPVKGVNALDAMVAFFSGLGMLRQQLPEKIRIHGIITNGGQSFNTIPEYTCAEIGVRALVLEEARALSQKIEQLVTGAATMTGCSSKMTLLSELPDVYVNVPLAQRLEQNYEVVGEKVVKRTYEQGVGSTDTGEVTYAVPGIHGYINITAGQDIPGHTREFAAAANSDEGYQAMLRAIKALALTTYDLYAEPSLLENVKQYFVEKRREF